MYHLLILSPMAPIGTIGSHCMPVLRIDIKGFQCFDHCLTEGYLRGTPWSLVVKPRREQTGGSFFARQMLAKKKALLGRLYYQVLGSL